MAVKKKAAGQSGGEVPHIGVDVKEYMGRVRSEEPKSTYILTAQTVREKMLKQDVLERVKRLGLDDPGVKKDVGLLVGEQLMTTDGQAVDQSVNLEFLRLLVEGQMEPLFLCVGDRNEYLNKITRLKERLDGRDFGEALKMVQHEASGFIYTDRVVGFVREVEDWMRIADIGDVSGVAAGRELMPAFFNDLMNLTFRLASHPFLRSDTPGVGLCETDLDLIENSVQVRQRYLDKREVLEHREAAEVLPGADLLGQMQSALEGGQTVMFRRQLGEDGEGGTGPMMIHKVPLTQRVIRTQTKGEAWKAVDLMDRVNRVFLLERLDRIDASNLPKELKDDARAGIITRSYRNFILGRMMVWVNKGADVFKRHTGNMTPKFWRPFPLSGDEWAKVDTILGKLEPDYGRQFLKAFPQLGGPSGTEAATGFIHDVYGFLEKSKHKGDDDYSSAESLILIQSIDDIWCGIIDELDCFSVDRKAQWKNRIIELTATGDKKPDEYSSITAMMNLGRWIDPILGLPSVHGLQIARELLTETEQIGDETRPVWDYLSHMAQVAYLHRRMEVDCRVISDTIKVGKPDEPRNIQAVTSRIPRMRSDSEVFGQESALKFKEGYDTYANMLAEGSVPGLGERGQKRQRELSRINDLLTADCRYIHGLVAAADDMLQADGVGYPAAVEYLRRYSIGVVRTSWTRESLDQDPMVPLADKITDSEFTSRFAQKLGEVEKIRELEDISWGEYSLSDYVSLVMCRSVEHLDEMTEEGFIDALRENAPSRRMVVRELLVAFNEDRFNAARALKHILRMEDAGRVKAAARSVTKGTLVEDDLAKMDWKEVTPANVDEKLRGLIADKDASRRLEDEFKTALAHSNLAVKDYLVLAERMPELRTADQVRGIDESLKRLSGDDRKWVMDSTREVAKAVDAEAALAFIHSHSIPKHLRSLDSTPQSKAAFKENVNALIGDFTPENVDQVVEDAFSDQAFQGALSQERYSKALDSLPVGGQTYERLASEIPGLQTLERVRQFHNNISGLNSDGALMLVEIADAAAEAANPGTAAEILFSRALAGNLSSLTETPYSARGYVNRVKARAGELRPENTNKIIREIYTGDDLQWMVGAEKMLLGLSVSDEERGRYIEAVKGASDEVRAVLSAMGVGNVIEGLKKDGFMNNVELAAAADVPEPPRPLYLEVAPDGTVNILEGGQEKHG